jgi:hypothetical protein
MGSPAKASPFPGPVVLDGRRARRSGRTCRCAACGHESVSPSSPDCVVSGLRHQRHDQLGTSTGDVVMNWTQLKRIKRRAERLAMSRVDAVTPGSSTPRGAP